MSICEMLSLFIGSLQIPPHPLKVPFLFCLQSNNEIYLLNSFLAKSLLPECRYTVTVGIKYMWLFVVNTLYCKTVQI